MSGLAIDTSYLISKLGITQEKIDQQYANMTVDEIIKAEATSGNQAAIELANQILNDPEFVIQLFGLASPENKLAILSQMNEQQLKEYLPLMDKKDLLQGMYFAYRIKSLLRHHCMSNEIFPIYFYRLILIINLRLNLFVILRLDNCGGHQKRRHNIINKPHNLKL